jgi:hypothetical protein
MHLHPLVPPRRRIETHHVRTDIARKYEHTNMDSTDTLQNRSSKEDTNLLDSATLSGLEQRLYIKFKDSIRN